MSEQSDMTACVLTVAGRLSDTG